VELGETVILIRAFITLLALLVGALIPRPASPHYAGRPPVVVVRPAHPRAGKPVTVVIAGVPVRARDVVLDADGVDFPARPAPHHTYTAAATASAVPGPWTLSVRFTLKGVSYTVLSGVVMVSPS
jgi:hypothetical protein